MTLTRTAAVLWIVAFLALVLGLAVPALRLLLVVAAAAMIACVVLGFRGRNRPDVEITSD